MQKLIKIIIDKLETGFAVFNFSSLVINEELQTDENNASNIDIMKQ